MRIKPDQADDLRSTDVRLSVAKLLRVGVVLVTMAAGLLAGAASFDTAPPKVPTGGPSIVQLHPSACPHGTCYKRASRSGPAPRVASSFQITEEPVPLSCPGHLGRCK